MTRCQTSAGPPRSGAGIFAAALLLALSAGARLDAASEVFLDLGPDLPGESQDKVHRGEVDVLAWSWGMANSGSTRVGGAGKASLKDLTLTKYVDAASPKLMELCANGGHLPTATLVVRKSGQHPVEYLKITLMEVMVSRLSAGGSAGGDRLQETVGLNFGKVSLTYLPVVNDQPRRGENFTWDAQLGEGGGGTLPVEPPAPVRSLAPTLTYANGAPLATLTWLSKAGANYQVWVATDVEGPFRRYGSPVPSAGDVETSLTVPAGALREFFRIETLPNR